jgi:tryptophan synthase beta chain
MQEVSAEREIEIPGEVRQIYAQWRPSPLMRARRLEKALDTPARIYYKYEGVSPAGSHKLNTAVPQAYYNKQEGVSTFPRKPAPASGALRCRWPAHSSASNCKVFMVRVSYDQKPYRRALIEALALRSSPAPARKPNQAAPFSRASQLQRLAWHRHL